MIKNPHVKNILAALAVAVFGFILLNLTFLFDWAVQSFIRRLFPANDNMAMQWLPPAKHIIFLIIIAFLSWLVFKSKLRMIFKAIYSTVPAAVTFVTVGICFYQWPIISYSINILIYAGTILYLYRTKKSWLYYYSVTLVAVSLLVMGIFGMEI